MDKGTLMNQIYSTIIDMDLGKKLDSNIVNKLINARLFKEYIESEGFNPEKYNQMLELNQDVVGSISILLRGYQQFLLSKKVNYDELHFTEIYGANGFVDKDGIFIPKTIEADDHFFGGYLPMVPYTRHWYEYPKLGENYCEYDVTISNGISGKDQFDLILRSDMDLFLGDVLDTTDENYKNNKIKLLKKLVQIRDNGSKLSISIDSDKQYGREYVLLSRKK